MIHTLLLLPVLLGCGGPAPSAPAPSFTVEPSVSRRPDPQFESECLHLDAFRNFPEARRARVVYRFDKKAVGVDFELFADEACLEKSATLSYLAWRGSRPYFVLKAFDMRLEVFRDSAKAEYLRRFRPQRGQTLDLQEPTPVDSHRWDTFATFARTSNEEDESRALVVHVAATSVGFSITAPRDDLYSPELTFDDLEFARRPKITLHPKAVTAITDSEGASGTAASSDRQ